MSENSNFLDQDRQSLLVYIWGKRKIIILVTSIGFVASIVISLLMTPIFKSTAIVFPAATSTVSFSEQRNAKASSMDFGEEEQAEQLVQILQSSRIRNRIVSEYNLMDHYEIASDDINKNYKLIKEWSSHIRFARTKYGSIQIDVSDKDAQLAAKMANKIVELIDTVKNEMIQERTIPAYQISLRKKKQLEENSDFVLARLDSFSVIGVVSREERATLLEAYNMSKNNEDKKQIKEQIKINNRLGATYDALETTRNRKMEKIADFEDAYEQAESDANTIFSHKFVVEPAVVADKKDKPKRMIVVLMATIGTLIFTIFLLLIKDKISELRKSS